jgi:hypothetical protein
MLQTWQSYCKDNNTTIIPKTVTKLTNIKLLLIFDK